MRVQGGLQPVLLEVGVRIHLIHDRRVVGGPDDFLDLVAVEVGQADRTPVSLYRRPEGPARYRHRCPEASR